MNHLGLSFRLLLRDWKSGEVRVLAMAIVIAVASISAVGFFTDRIGKALELQANELLGGDLTITATAPLPDEYTTLAQQFQLSVVATAQFPSMALSGDRHQIASVKSAEEGYPLRGNLRISDALFAPDFVAQGIPASGEVWAESRLLSALGVSVGEMLTLGASELKVTAVITSEPSRAGGNVFSIAPALLMNASDLERTQLITPASRVRYVTLFSGDADDIDRFRQQVEKKLKPGQRIQGIDDARPEIKSTVDKAERFLGLAALVSVILACVAVAMAARRFVSRHLDNCAIMRCYGANQSLVIRLYTMQMIWLGLCASGIGLLIGFAMQFVLVGSLGELAKVSLPAPSLMPAVVSLLVGVVTLLGFSYPTLLHLRNVPTLRVLRRDLGALPASSWSTYLLGGFVLCLLAMWQAKDALLGMSMLLGTALTLLLLAVAAILLVKLAGRLVPNVSLQWRFAVSNVQRRAYSNVVQVVAFGLGLMVLLILVVVRSDLLAEWDDRIPENTPNRFLINIQPDQVDHIKNFLQAELGREPDIYPMLRARLTAINETEVTENDYENDRAKRLVLREFNLSWAADLPPENTVVKGDWWEKSGEQAFSVEEGLAKTLGIKIGDSLTFDVASEHFTATVTNFRHVEWDNFRVNFFVIASDGNIDQYPSTYITSFYLPSAQYEVLNELLKEFPNVTVIDVAAVLEQVRRIIDRVTQTIEYVFIFTLLAGLMVLYAAIHATLDERMREAAILRTLGATRIQVLMGLIVEFVFLGLLAGLVAALAANGVGSVLADKVFNLDYGFSPTLWLFGLLVGGVVIGLAGVFGTRQVLRQPPLQILREYS